MSFIDCIVRSHFNYLANDDFFFFFSSGRREKR